VVTNTQSVPDILTLTTRKHHTSLERKILKNYF
jgi:hypothetical protein